MKNYVSKTDLAIVLSTILAIILVCNPSVIDWASGHLNELIPILSIVILVVQAILMVVFAIKMVIATIAYSNAEDHLDETRLSIRNAALGLGCSFAGGIILQFILTAFGVPTLFSGLF